MGLAVSKLLHKKGWKVSILDMSTDAGNAVAQELDGIFTRTDVSSYESQAAAFEKTWETYGRIDFGKTSVDSVCIATEHGFTSICERWHRGEHKLLPRTDLFSASSTIAALL